MNTEKDIASVQSPLLTILGGGGGGGTGGLAKAFPGVGKG